MQYAVYGKSKSDHGSDWVAAALYAILWYNGPRHIEFNVTRAV